MCEMERDTGHQSKRLMSGLGICTRLKTRHTDDVIEKKTDISTLSVRSRQKNIDHSAMLTHTLTVSHEQD